MIIAMASRVNADTMSDEESRLFSAFVEERRKDKRSPEKAPVPGIGTRTLRRYIVGGEVPTRLEDDTKVAMARYLTEKGISGFEDLASVRAAANGNGHSSLSRQIDAILASKADELTKTARMIDLWGIYRQKAITDVAELLRGDKEILRLRAQAVADIARAGRIETEVAARRDEEASLDRREARESKRAADLAARADRQGKSSGETKIETGEQTGLGPGGGPT